MTWDNSTGHLTYTEGRLTEKHLDYLICQYGQSANLRALFSAFFAGFEIVEKDMAAISAAFDIETATGDALTILGERAGWPRTHCAAQCTPVFGWLCDDNERSGVLGWCEGEWLCDENSTGRQDYTFVDDDLYRRFIKAKRLANASVGTAVELVEIARLLFDSDDVGIMGMENRKLDLLVQHHLTDEEFSVVELIKRILPAPIGTVVSIYESDGPPFGWDCGTGDCGTMGWCEGSFVCKVELDC